MFATLLGDSIGLSSENLLPIVGYTEAMSTVSERLQEESRQRLRKMTVAERLAEALELGERAIDTYASAHGIDRDKARRRLEEASQAGRRPSRVMSELVR